MSKPTNSISLVKPFLALIVLSVVMLVAAVGMVSYRSNDLVRSTFSDYMLDRIELREEAISKLLNDIVDSPDSFAALHTSKEDADALRRMEISKRLADSFSANEVVIISPKGDILYSELTSSATMPPQFAFLEEDVARLLAIFSTGVSDSVVIDRVAVGDAVIFLAMKHFMVGDDARFVVVTAPLQDHSQTATLSGADEVVTALYENVERMSDLQFVGIKNRVGTTIGWYGWQKFQPASQTLREYAPLAVIMLGLILAVTFLFFRKYREFKQAVSQQQENAEFRALHDPLTGLANRSLLIPRIELAIEQYKRGSKGFAVHMIDLDRFKQVNDSFGHPSGDQLIVQAAKRLEEICRKTDTVARLGGDEFAIVQTDVSSPASASRLSRRAVEQLSNAFKIEDADVFVSGSIGVAVCLNQVTTREEILRQADIALYRAKANGRNRVCFFEEEMDREIKHRRENETSLRLALSQPDKHGLRVVYQPQFSANGRHIRGLEALTRWTHPSKGPMSPAEFIPIAEETGLIVQLGEFVARQAFSVAERWPEITMAINVSAYELHQKDFAKNFAKLATEYNIRPDQIELEITETVLLEDSAHVARTIKSLKTAGFKIALDDFGTGYSSLSYLRRHQVDKLKIDQSFVSSIGVRDDANAVVQAIIQLGEALGLSVTAEGVETEAQRDALREQGCAYLQGYLFSRPLDTQDLAKLMQVLRDKRAKAQRQKPRRIA